MAQSSSTAGPRLTAPKPEKESHRATNRPSLALPMELLLSVLRVAASWGEKRVESQVDDACGLASKPTGCCSSNRSALIHQLMLFRRSFPLENLDAVSSISAAIFTQMQAAVGTTRKFESCLLDCCHSLPQRFPVQSTSSAM